MKRKLLTGHFRALSSFLLPPPPPPLPPLPRAPPLPPLPPLPRLPRAAPVKLQFLTKKSHLGEADKQNEMRKHLHVMFRPDILTSENVRNVLVVFSNNI